MSSGRSSARPTQQQARPSGRCGRPWRSSARACSGMRQRDHLTPPGAAMSEADVAALRAEYVTACALEPWGEAAAVAALLAYEPVASRPEFARHVTRGGRHWAKVLAAPACCPERP